MITIKGIELSFHHLRSNVDPAAILLSINGLPETSTGLIKGDI